MKKISFILLLSVFAFTDSLTAQIKYWVMFKDKNGTPYSTSTPSAYLSAKSIARRSAQGIGIDNSDLPVTPSYVSQVAAVPGVTVFYRSKWLNGIVVVLTNTAVINTINSFSFVTTTNQVHRYRITLPIVNASLLPDLGSGNKVQATSGYNYGPAAWQAAMLGVDCMHNLGFRGQGMTIAVLDAGFQNANTNSVFDSLFMENRLLGTRDLVMGDTMVFEDDIHGAYCLSTMAANQPGIIIGTAPKAKYWLLRSEDVSTETISEEYNWVRGAEFADSVGADICTTSLGYNQFDGGLNDHTYADLTGRKAPMSIAANMAARKGMFILNAAGNEGTSTWHYICVPADADSICTVGAVDSLKNKANFSSFGPTADGRIKPDLCARGQSAYVCSPTSTNAFYGSGTSFATPILAGAVACLWQSKHALTNMQLLRGLKQYASNSLSPNNAIGWGIPNVCYTYNSTIGIQEITTNDKGVSVFPNPVGNVMTVSLSDKELSVIKITDVFGKEIKCEIIKQNEGTLYSVNTSSFLGGVYFVTIGGPNQMITKKFVKQ
jgi:serine protease AprX